MWLAFDLDQLAALELVLGLHRLVINFDLPAFDQHLHAPSADVRQRFGEIRIKPHPAGSCFGGKAAYAVLGFEVVDDVNVGRVHGNLQPRIASLRLRFFSHLGAVGPGGDDPAVGHLPLRKVCGIEHRFLHWLGAFIARRPLRGFALLHQRALRAVFLFHRLAALALRQHILGRHQLAFPTGLPSANGGGSLLRSCTAYRRSRSRPCSLHQGNRSESGG